MISELEPFTNTIPRSLAATVLDPSGFEPARGREEERAACAPASLLRLRMIKESTKSSCFLVALRYMVHSLNDLLCLVAHCARNVCSFRNHPASYEGTETGIASLSRLHPRW